MRFLKYLDVGDRFRPAHSRAVSLNNRKMPRTDVYKVIRVYEMSPHLTIAARESSPDDGFYSLGPDVPVLHPLEPDPSEEEVRQFIGVKVRRKVVAYKVLWDGKTDLRGIVSPQAAAAMKLMYAMGKPVYGLRELNVLFSKHFKKFWNKPLKYDASLILATYHRKLVSQGLIEEIVDVGPIPESVREANLQEEF
jgi:hypothetical protein